MIAPALCNPIDVFRRRDPAADAVAARLSRDAAELVAHRWAESTLGRQPRPPIPEVPS